MQTELRRSRRVPFIAAAEVVELEDDVHLRARTGDLCEHGCYLDMINPLPSGTTVRVQIVHGSRTFDCLGSVVYSQTPLGMGVVFRDVLTEHQDLLHEWINDPERLLA